MLRSYKGSSACFGTAFHIWHGRFAKWHVARAGDPRWENRVFECIWRSLAEETWGDRFGSNLQALAFSDVLADLMDWLPEPFPSRSVAATNEILHLDLGARTLTALREEVPGKGGRERVRRGPGAHQNAHGAKASDNWSWGSPSARPTQCANNGSHSPAQSEDRETRYQHGRRHGCTFVVLTLPLLPRRRRLLLLRSCSCSCSHVYSYSHSQSCCCCCSCSYSGSYFSYSYSSCFCWL